MLTPTEEARYVSDQNAAHRKGLVLGLTMAEIGFLIIFVLLLLIGYSAIEENRLEETIRTQREAKVIADEVTAVLGAGPNPTVETVRDLVRVLAATQGRDGATALAEAKSIIDSLRQERATLSRTANALAESMKKGGLKHADSVAKTLAGLQFDNQNKEGQLRRYEDRLKAVGEGKGERPCWVRPDGTIEYLYDVVLQSDGIRMREIAHPNRTEQRALLQMPPPDSDRVLKPLEFLAATRPLYQSSLARNCRFFVVIYDRTGPTEKVMYKQLLRTVEEHFYKRLDSGDAPF